MWWIFIDDYMLIEYDRLLPSNNNIECSCINMMEHYKKTAIYIENKIIMVNV